MQIQQDRNQTQTRVKSAADSPACRFTRGSYVYDPQRAVSSNWLVLSLTGRGGAEESAESRCENSRGQELNDCGIPPNVTPETPTGQRGLLAHVKLSC